WDKSALGAIEKGIQRANLGLNPVNDGNIIRIEIPPLTEERRKELIKVAGQIAENGRVSVRTIRRESNESLKKAEKEGEIGEDESFSGQKRIQELTDKYITEIDKLLKLKEEEIMTI
ncbi:MAG: ribosome-recycling factor, partial [bacterium]